MRRPGGGEPFLFGQYLHGRRIWPWESHLHPGCQRLDLFIRQLLLGRHLNVALMPDCLDEQALLRLADDDRFFARLADGEQGRALPPLRATVSYSNVPRSTIIATVK